MTRLLLRRLISPLELYDASKPEWQMPDFIKADCVVKTGLIDGLAEIHDVASPTGFSHPACLGLPVEGYSELAV